MNRARIVTNMTCVRIPPQCGVVIKVGYKIDIKQRSVLNPYKPRVLFVGHRQTVQTQIRRRRTPRLIRVYIVCLQNVLSKIKKK